jgi:hypothetical protein
MAHEAYRIYGWNNGSEPERYRLHVQDYQPAYSTPQNTYGYHGSSPGADYIDRSRYPRTEDHIAPHVGSSRQSRRRKNEYYSNSDYIAPPTDSREDYISQAYDTPPSFRNRDYDVSMDTRMPGGFYDSEVRLDRRSRSANFHENENVNRVIKDADFSNEHEVMRAYWVPGPQDYDEMDLSGVGMPRHSKSRSKSRLGSKAKRVTYESDVESESDVKTYVDDSGEEDGKRIIYDSGEDERRTPESRSRMRSGSRRREVAGNRWDQASHMPGGYASSSPSPSIHYESDEPPARYRRVSISSDTPHRRARTTTRYASSSPRMRSRSRSHHLSSSKSPIRPRCAPSPPTLSDYGRNRYPSRSTSPPRPRTRTRTRNPRAPSPPSLTTRFHSSSSTPRSASFLSSRSPSLGPDRHYLSESDKSNVVPCRGVRGVRGNRGFVGSDEESDFVINGGSECDFEGDDIWCDSSDDGRGGLEYDED